MQRGDCKASQAISTVGPAFSARPTSLSGSLMLYFLISSLDLGPRWSSQKSVGSEHMQRAANIVHLAGVCECTYFYLE